MLRRVPASVVSRARVAARGVHTEAKLKEMGIELPTPKAPLGMCTWYVVFLRRIDTYATDGIAAVPGI